jgi:hypothetical protein
MISQTIKTGMSTFDQKDRPCLSAVIPAKNEAKTIERVISEAGSVSQ